MKKKYGMGGLAILMRKLGREPARPIKSPSVPPPPMPVENDRRLRGLVNRRATAMMAKGGKVKALKELFKVVETRNQQVKSVLDNEEKAWDLADRLQGSRGVGHHVVSTTESDPAVSEWRNSVVKKAEGGKVKPVVRSIKQARNLSRLTLQQLKRRQIALETNPNFESDPALQQEWEAIFNEAERRGVTLIDDQ